MKTKKVFVATFIIISEYSDGGYYISYASRETPYEEDHMADYGWVFITQEEVEISEPDFDIREKLLAGLEGEKRKIMAEYAKSMASIEDKISKLQALEVLS